MGRSRSGAFPAQSVKTYHIPVKITHTPTGSPKTVSRVYFMPTESLAKITHTLTGSPKTEFHVHVMPTESLATTAGTLAKITHTLTVLCL
jgi:hypothetical protein